ncbi:MAG TPA: M48 family metallopeptidase [Candidatus Brocadiia bacterium]|nr:M48 family metallopeptidase [Candidatus Brocadiales bacterium]
MRRYVISIFFSSLFSISLLTTGISCSTNQFFLTTEQQERQIGEEEYRKLLAQSSLSADEQLNEMVRQIGERIAAVTPRPDLPYEFNVIVDDKVNAFTLPGGKVIVFTGMIKIAEYEARLATVMSHEIAHAILRHGAQQMTRAVELNLMGQALDIFLLKGKGAVQREMLRNIWGIGSTVFGVLPYSREMEYEADAEGLVYMSKAGYDPHEAIEFVKKISQVGPKPVEFLSTHPSNPNRIEKLREKLPEAIGYYQAAKVKTEGKGRALTFRGEQLLPRGSPSQTRRGVLQYAPTIRFEAIWVEHDVMMAGTSGINVHTKFTISNFAGKDGFVNVYFSLPNGQWLVSNDGRYQAKRGYVLSSAPFRANYPDTTFPDFKVFIPYHELHLPTGNHNLVANVFIVDTKNNLIGRASTHFQVVRRW